jgi:transcriptional regulator with PAS, ATPase and Fis domain
MADAALLSDLAYLQRAADMVPSVLAYWGADLRCRYANRAHADWFGVESRSLIGRSLREFLGEQEFSRNEPQIAGVLAGQAQTFEQIVAGPDGVERSALVQFVPDVVEGQVAGFVVHAAEVTRLNDRQTKLRLDIQALEAQIRQLRDTAESLTADQHRLEATNSRIAGEKETIEVALQDVTRLLDVLKESVVDHIAMLDRNGTVMVSNSAWDDFAKLCGTEAHASLPRSEVGSNYVVECAAVAGPMADDAAQAAEGIAAVLSGQRDLYTLEYKCTVAREQRWFHLSATRLKTSASGAVIVHADITPGRVQRVRAHESRATLRFGH